MQAEVRETAAIVAQPGTAPAQTVAKEEQRDGYRVQTLSIQSEPGMDLTMVQAIPDGSNRKPVILMMEEAPAERTAATADFARLVKSGHIVLVLQSRGTPIDAQSGQSTQFALGPYMGVNLRAIIVGKTLVGMRTDDVIRVLNWLSARPDVDRTSITLYGKGGLGMVALHAAALDTRITGVMAENSLVSYRTALDAPLHRNLSEITIPGVLQHYDVSDLLEAIAPREVTLLNPADALGQPMRFEQGARAIGFAKSGPSAPSSPWPARSTAHRMKINRRDFLQQAAVAAIAVRRPEFRTANSRWQAAYDPGSRDSCREQFQVLPRYSKPVLTEGANYAGIWMESGTARGPALSKIPAGHRAQQPPHFLCAPTPGRTAARQQQSIGDGIWTDSDGSAHRRNRMGTGPVVRRR